MSAIACLCTCPDADTARRLAGALVGERLAACVNLLPGVRSVYRWQGEVHEDQEVLLVVKTTRARLDALTERIRALHPYELPEIIAVPVVKGLSDYLHWVTLQTSANQ